MKRSSEWAKTARHGLWLTAAAFLAWLLRGDLHLLAQIGISLVSLAVLLLMIDVL